MQFEFWMDGTRFNMSFFLLKKIPHSKPAIFLEITYKTNFFLRTVQEKKNPSALN